jgi:hypothetical protein
LNEKKDVDEKAFSVTIEKIVAYRNCFRFSSSERANPTLTIIHLAMRAADDVTKHL